ncbi:hypothetical protein OOT00_14500 [Desulfobotulus sp. H1]|uniref:Uncharacterized protein n=1 Tax=Desulfobotulus pelophilus TaxID=2823377 RepID=A0ABT3NCK2_9BACT|nr:hypothetical protein [Desulfobotulus pelophilus]MCW7755195.1 hypothetical protein [Desulfobotulus pelophilus]
MDQKEFAKSILSYNKAAFDQFLASTTMAQGQMEKFAEMLLVQDSTPEDGKKMIQEWLNNIRQTRSDIHESMTNSYRQMETYFLSLIP